MDKITFLDNRDKEELQEQINNISGGSSVQSDWNQSDETAPDYVKNRTHYEDKDIITWDQNETGRFRTTDDIFGDIPPHYFVKISDKTYTREQLIGASMSYGSNQRTQVIQAEDIEDLFENGSAYRVNYLTLIICNPENCLTYNGVNFSDYEAGIYVGVITIENAYTSPLTKLEVVNKIVKLDEKYLPDSIVQKINYNQILDYITYEINEGCVTITNCNKLITGSYIIPNTIEGYIVTTIGDEAFRSCSNLTNILLPPTITTIGEWAFSSCTGLTDIVIPNQVITIGNNAFTNCTGLKTIAIGNSVVDIGKWAFLNCTGITDITIPDSVVTIGMRAFSKCTNLTHLTLGKSIKHIWSNAFAECVNLRRIDYRAIAFGSYSPDPSGLFVDSDLLSAFNIENGVEHIPSWVIAHSTVSSLYIPKSVKVIEDYALMGNVEDIYYEGTPEDWAQITVYGNNGDLVNATIHYNQAPATEDYVNNLNHQPKINASLADLAKPHSTLTHEHILPGTNNYTAFPKDITTARLSLYNQPEEDFKLYVSNSKLVPCSIYASASALRCFTIPEGYPVDEQVTITIDYHSRDITASDKERERVLFATVNYTDGTTEYFDVVPIADNTAAATFTTTANKTIKTIGIDKHSRWTNGKVVISNILVQSANYEKLYGSDAYSSAEAIIDDFGKMIFNIIPYENTYVADTTANGLEFFVDDGFNKIYKQIDETNDSLNNLYSSTLIGSILYENELINTGNGHYMGEKQAIKLGRPSNSPDPFNLYIGRTELAPSVYYGTGLTQRCVGLPLGNYKSGQIQLVIRYEAFDITTSNNDADRILFATIVYTNGTTAYQTIAPITGNGQYTATITTEAGKNVAAIYIEKHARWIGGKIVITNVQVNEPNTTNSYYIASCNTYPSNTIATLEYGQYLFDLNISNLSTNKIYIADNLPGVSQYNIIVEPQDQMAGIKEELASMQLDLLKLLSSGITSELVKPGTKTTLEFNSAYVLVSANSDIVLRDGTTGQHMKDTGGSNLPTGKLCIVILPKQTIGETSRRLCYYIATSGSLDGAAKHFYVANDNTVFTTPPSSNLTVFKIHFPE